MKKITSPLIIALLLLTFTYASEWEWAQIGGLKEGDYLMDKDRNEIEITSIETIYDKKGVMVYDLEIANYHYYFAEDVLVHNSESYLDYLYSGDTLTRAQSIDTDGDGIISPAEFNTAQQNDPNSVNGIERGQYVGPKGTFDSEDEVDAPESVTVTITPPEEEVAEQQTVTPTTLTYDSKKHTQVTMGTNTFFISGNNIHNMDGTQAGTNVQLIGNAIIYSPITDNKVGQPTYYGPLGNGIQAKDGKFDFGGDIGTIDTDHINNDGTMWKSTSQGMRYYYHSGKTLLQSRTPIRLLGNDLIELSIINYEGYAIVKTNGDVVIMGISGRTPGKHGMIYRTADGYVIIDEKGEFVDEEGNKVHQTHRITSGIRWAYFSSWFGNLLADMADATSGYSGVSFFYDEPDPVIELDETMSNLLGGIDGWTSEICKADVVDAADDMGMAVSPFASGGAYAHIQGEKLKLTNFNISEDGVTTYLYKISFVVSSGSETRGCDIEFKVELDGVSLFTKDGSDNVFKTKRDDEDENTVSYTGSSMLVLEYENNYNELCIHFEKDGINPELITGSQRCLIGVDTDEHDKICTTIHDGGAREMETEDPCGNALLTLFMPTCWFGGPGTEDEDWTQGEGTGGTLTSGDPASEDGEVILNPGIS